MKLSLYTYTLYSILKEQPWSLSVKVSALERVHCKEIIVCQNGINGAEKWN